MHHVCTIYLWVGSLDLGRVSKRCGVMGGILLGFYIVSLAAWRRERGDKDTTPCTQKQSGSEKGQYWIFGWGIQGDHRGGRNGDV